VIKLGEVVMILDFRRQGLTVSVIARGLGVDRKTVRRCIARGLETPVCGPRQPRHRLIHPFAPYLREPTVTRIIWLFSLVLGFSRLIWTRFVLHQDMQAVLRCHMVASRRSAAPPHEIRYDRMKTAVIGAVAGSIVYNRALSDIARHYGFQPKACRPYRAKTKGKVERPYRYIREDFFLARSFRNLDDLNAQLRHWLDTVAIPRIHATTQPVVNEAFAEEKPHPKSLPLAPFRSVLKLERRVSHEGMVSVGGNLYSVPDATRKRIVEVHTLVHEVRIFQDGNLIAAHPVLEGRNQRRVAPGHRRMARIADHHRPSDEPIRIVRTGDVVPAPARLLSSRRSASGGPRSNRPTARAR
jgi:transposase